MCVCLFVFVCVCFYVLMIVKADKKHTHLISFTLCLCTSFKEKKIIP